MLSLRSCRNMNGGIILLQIKSRASEYPEHHDANRVFAFHQYGYDSVLSKSKVGDRSRG